jgi:hypothetical protein
MKTISILFLLGLLASCQPAEDSSDGVSCSFSTGHFYHSGTETYSTGEKAAQKFKITRDIKLKQLTIEMDALNSQSLKVSIFKRTQTSLNPTDGEFLTSVTRSSSSISNTGKIEFKFSQAPSIEMNKEHYFVVEAIGGNFEMTKQLKSFYAIDGNIEEFSSNNWSSSLSYDYSFGISGTGCPPGI